MVLDRPLALGADGGHGAIRYYVSEYEPAGECGSPSARERGSSVPTS